MDEQEDWVEKRQANERTSASFQKVYTGTLFRCRTDELKSVWGQYLENSGKKSGPSDNNSVIEQVIQK